MDTKRWFVCLSEPYNYRPVGSVSQELHVQWKAASYFHKASVQDPTLGMNVRDIRLPSSGEDWDAARSAVDPCLSPAPPTASE